MMFADRLFPPANPAFGWHLTPVVRLAINGQPFGSETMSRIISVELTDKRGFEADELVIELNDYDGSLAIPQQGDRITLALGFDETGVVDKGEFVFAQFTHAGSPDTLSITARAADLAETLAEQKEKSWHKQTLYQIVESIAQMHGYTGEKCRIAEQYRQTQIAHIDQTNESDASFLSRLAEQYGAIATVKYGILLFLPEGAAQTASGQAIAPVVITRRSGDRHSFSYDSANAYNAVRAFYTDRGTGQKKEVLVQKDNAKAQRPPEGQGHRRGQNQAGQTRKINTEGLKIKTLRHLYANQANAYAGARAAFAKLQRGAAQFSLTLATGRPDLYPETPITVAGFKAEIDAEKWLVVEVQHQINDGGYVSNVKLEAQIKEDEAT